MPCHHTQRKPVALSCNCSFLQQVPVVFSEIFIIILKVISFNISFHCELIVILLQQFPNARIIFYLQAKHLKIIEGNLLPSEHSINRNKGCCQ